VLLFYWYAVCVVLNRRNNKYNSYLLKVPYESICTNGGYSGAFFLLFLFFFSSLFFFTTLHTSAKEALTGCF
jgi:hypothetical protein